ncbi:uncharacterized protein B0J16DRAFT_89652 [Fusarium flagelliforme]|uniref:Velvet domain-containing protein n=1 Tax=Fusarium flagelliforme TaxID=2675880 RepID=A0A395MLA2_9HYPO|nr:uncharacterized protein B0J16DRAFT_89652 [Fusarium flagelliforme]KAH7188240.1 hypothetical protein B0J16DRAFT_89652 [Fusarium flagelliforme]RFN48716.1 hypothetical protein FIE12Z_7035 [Fusarium flagelliforme]
MPTLTIAVQPPSRARISTIFYPPLVAELTFKGPLPGYYFFAMALLLTRNGDIVEEGLTGTTSVTGVDITAHIGSSRTTIYFPFTDLGVLAEGSYKIRVDVYKGSYENPDGFTYQEQTKSSRITVVNEEVPPGNPSSAERGVIRTLQSVGVPIP